MRIGLAVAALMATLPIRPAFAQAMRIDLPAGRLGRQVLELGRLTGASIVVPDAGLWSRPVPALRGRMTIPEAIRRIARKADANAEPLGPDSWRLAPRSPLPAHRPGPPHAHRAPARAPADIVVTASKRDLGLDHIAAQVERIDGVTLALGGAGGSDRLVSRLASVASTYLGAGRNKLFIRGIADSSFTGPTQSTVGQYLGDLRLSYNAPDPDLRLADLAAVEVLEGPQGTLYGAGSLGGIIRLVPNAPDLSGPSAKATLGVSATRSGAPGADAEAMLNLPLATDRLGLRIVATDVSEGGYIDKPPVGCADVNRTRIAGGRAALRWRIGGGWSAELIGVGQRIRGADGQYADRGGPPLSRAATVTEGFAADYAQAQLAVAGAIGEVRLRSTTGFTTHDLTERYDATAPEGPARLFVQANRTRMHANETRAWATRADGSGWLAGFSHIRNESRLTRRFSGAGRPEPATGVSNGVRETTLYGEASFRPLARLLVSAGMRLTRSAIDGESEDAPGPPPPAELAAARRAPTIALPAVSALAEVAPRAAVFLRYQQGFRPGGLAIEGNFVRRFRKDRVATTEAGFRAGVAGRDPFDLSMTLAHTAWRDIQADFIDGSGLPSTANIGDGTLWTIEATAGAAIANGLRAEGAVSLNDSRIDQPSHMLLAALAEDGESDPAAARDALSARLRQIPNIARATARLGLSWRRRLGDARELHVDGWVRYVGSSRLGVGPVLGQPQGDYLDSGATARLAFGPIGVTLGVANLADVRGNRFALGTPFATGRSQMTPLRPRTVRLGVDARF